MMQYQVEQSATKLLIAWLRYRHLSCSLWQRGATWLGKSDRGVRTEDSGVVEKSLPVTDASSGDEGIDDVHRKNRAESGLLEVPEEQTSTPPAFKDKHDLP